MLSGKSVNVNVEVGHARGLKRVASYASTLVRQEASQKVATLPTEVRILYKCPRKIVLMARKRS